MTSIEQDIKIGERYWIGQRAVKILSINYDALGKSTVIVDLWGSKILTNIDELGEKVNKQDNPEEFI